MGVKLLCDRYRIRLWQKDTDLYDLGPSIRICEPDVGERHSPCPFLDSFLSGLSGKSCLDSFRCSDSFRHFRKKAVKNRPWYRFQKCGETDFGLVGFCEVW